MCDTILDNGSKWWMSFIKCKSVGICFLFFFLLLLFLVVVPYPVSFGQCFLQRSNNSITLTGIFLSNERLGVDERIPVALVFTVPTHDFLTSKFWMPKVCKRGRTLPMLVRSSPKACCCQWMAAMAHTALPTERCALVWICLKLPKAVLKNVTLIICHLWNLKEKVSRFLLFGLLIANFLIFWKTETKPATK